MPWTEHRTMITRMNRNDEPGAKLRRLDGVLKRNRALFLESEFSLAFTFCDLAETEYKVGNRQHAERLVKRATEAAAKAGEYLENSGFPEKQVEEMRGQLEQLRERLRELRHQAA